MGQTGRRAAFAHVMKWGSMELELASDIFMN